jgi:hypothetical protein
MNNGIPEQLGLISKYINEMWIAFNNIEGSKEIDYKSISKENSRIMWKGLSMIRYNLDNYIETRYNIHHYGGENEE